MFARLADLINRHPWRVLAVAIAVTVIAAPLGINVREHLKPRGFDVAGSGSAKARELIEHGSGTDPASSVLARVRPSDRSSIRARSAIAFVESKLRRDCWRSRPFFDWRSADNPAMIGRDRRSTYSIAALRPLDDEQQEQAGSAFEAFVGDAHVTLGGSPVEPRSRRRSKPTCAERSCWPCR